MLSQPCSLWVPVTLVEGELNTISTQGYAKRQDAIDNLWTAYQMFDGDVDEETDITILDFHHRFDNNVRSTSSDSIEYGLIEVLCPE